MRENLVEHFDFEVLYPQLWLYLYSWFSADCQIVRYLRKDKLHSGQYRLELYPASNFDQLSQSFIGNKGQHCDEDDDDCSLSSSDEEVKESLRQKRDHSTSNLIKQPHQQENLLPTFKKSSHTERIVGVQQKEESGILPKQIFGVQIHRLQQ